VVLGEAKLKNHVQVLAKVRVENHGRGRRKTAAPIAHQGSTKLFSTRLPVVQVRERSDLV